MRQNDFHSAAPVWAALSPLVLWLAAIAAYAYEDGMNLFQWMGRFSQVLECPFAIGWAQRHQQSACRAQQFAFGICDKIGAIRAVNIGFAEKAGLAGTGAAHHQNIHVALGDIAVHTQPDALGQNDIGVLVLVIHILSVQFLGTAPFGAAVFFARSPVLLAGVVERNAAAVE